jgi:hypothetical protein
MERKNYVQAILLSLLMVFSGVLYPAEPMSAEALEDLLTNNTMYCKNTNKNKEFVNFYREDGTVTKLLPDGTTWEGLWRVTDDGKHCQDWGVEDGEGCFPIVDMGNGHYQKIDKGKPKTDFTVTKGNSENL